MGQATDRVKLSENRIVISEYRDGEGKIVVECAVQGDGEDAYQREPDMKVTSPGHATALIMFALFINGTIFQEMRRVYGDGAPDNIQIHSEVTPKHEQKPYAA